MWSPAELAHSVQSKNLSKWLCGEETYFCICYSVQDASEAKHLGEKIHCSDVAENHYIAFKKPTWPWVQIHLPFMHVYYCVWAIKKERKHIFFYLDLLLEVAFFLRDH